MNQRIMDRSHSSSTKGAALQQRKYAERLLLLRIFQISSWQSLSEFQVTTFKYLGRCHEPLPPVYWVPSLLEIRAGLELHQWFSRFGLVCIEVQIHTNPFTMYLYVFGLYWRLYSKPKICIYNSCVDNTYMLKGQIQTQYAPIQKVSS